MTLVVTEAILLHAFDYLESSRIVRLLTRDGGVQSALARGARKSRARYGSSLDLFAQGTAQLHTKPHRELHTLSGFELTKSRPGLAEDVGRFTAASAVCELALRFAGEDSGPVLYVTDPVGFGSGPVTQRIGSTSGSQISITRTLPNNGLPVIRTLHFSRVSQLAPGCGA